MATFEREQQRLWRKEYSRDRSEFKFEDWADGIFFSLDREGNEQLLDADGQQIMMQWEKPYMEACVEELDVTASCDVLEVGFGCGYSATRIQEKSPKSHTIIECSEAVLVELRAWAASRPSVAREVLVVKFANVKMT